MNNLRPLRIKKNHSSRKLVPLLLVVSVLVAFAFFIFTRSGTSSYVSQVLSGTSLKSVNGQINVLLLGIAGGTHDGANLTDTIMVASYNLKTNQVYLISIPRDLWLPSLQSKANAVYEIGLAQKNGLGLSKTVFGNVLGLPISYALRLDFRGFTEAVDTLGGLDVVVDNPFDDYNYPIEGKENDLCGYQEKEINSVKVFVAPDGTIASDSAQEDMGAKYFTCRYEHIHFDKGVNHMDGTTALKFARSRHGTNGEASDFARSKRQQKVLEAIKAKLLSFDTLANPTKISGLLSTFGKSIDTDISVQDAIEFYKLFRKAGKPQSFVIDESILVHPPVGSYGGAYVLVSQDDDFSIVQGYVRKILTGELSEYDATASARSGN